MFFPFLAVTGIAVSLVKLGQLSIMVKVLSALVQLLLAIIAIGIVVALWKRFSSKS